MEYIIRFFTGAIIVSVFAVIGDMFRPRTLSGIFGSAPTIAIATLSLGFFKGDVDKIPIEGGSMMIGTIALAIYSTVTAYLVLRKNWSSLPAACLSYLSWLIAAFGIYFALGAIGL